MFSARHRIPNAVHSCHERRMIRSEICVYLGPADRAELEALMTNRNTPRKLAWRPDIVLETADCAGTVEIMGRTGLSKPTVWRWQERYLDKGVPGLKRDKTRPSCDTSHSTTRSCRSPSCGAERQCRPRRNGTSPTLISSSNHRATFWDARVNQ